VVADNVRFLESAGGANRGEDGANGAQNRSGMNSARNNNQDPFIDDGRPVDISDDDLPF
jgi:single-strand DNA-binding protein